MIYLDYAANAPVLPEVFEAMHPWLCPDHVGNPSSIHTQGVKARKAIDNARYQVAKMIGANPSEVFFTSGGTESNNAWLKCFSGKTIFTSCLEHDSVVAPLMNDATRYIIFVTANKDGSIDLNRLEAMFKKEAGLGSECALSVMWVNNELGTVNPMKEIGNLCKTYNVILHTDAVQAAGHIPIDVNECGIDFLSVSGHKFGSPLGVGALYINSKIKKKPWILGGGQESNLRGGTENVPGIVGLGKAAEIVSQRLTTWRLLWRDLRCVFLNELHSQMPGEYYINGDDHNECSNIVSMTIPGVNSESLLLLLDQQGIYISAGSACSAADSKPSHVLKGIGLSDDDAASTVRISMGTDTHADDMREAARIIAKITHKLKSMYS